jgi:hypothetical protein
MYKIIGGDKNEYGPVAAQVLRDWIAEGRLSGQSLVQAEGSGEWKPLAAVAEFADALRPQATTPVTSAGATAPPLSAAGGSAQILLRPPQVRVGRCLASSWNLLARNFPLFFGACFWVWLISLSEFIPLVGFLYRVFAGVLYGGLYLIFLNRIRGNQASVTDVFAGFRLALTQLLLAGFLTILLGWIGLLFCLLPGIYLPVAWAFSVPLVADKGLEFWSAMELSRKVTTRVWFEIFALILVAFLPFLLISIFAKVQLFTGVFAALHDMMASGHLELGHMSEVMTGIIKKTLPLTLMTKFIFLLNMPFALGALMYAYEDLFGTGTPRAS